MQDNILFRKLQIWYKLPEKYTNYYNTLSSNYGTIEVKKDIRLLIIKSIWIKPEYRGMGIWGNLLGELEKLNVEIKLQSVLNSRLCEYMKKRKGWRRMNSELSFIYNP